ncbi:MAG: hypothetical protein HY690_14470 [Chloroflexi bacterium]|nr:hypothetical protein [Chloroflexota bacterium]
MPSLDRPQPDQPQPGPSDTPSDPAAAQPASRKRRPISARRLAANRANAQRSTGPRTPQGKAVSSQNALRHGMRADSLALLATASEEERVLFERLMAQLTEAYHPESPQEQFLVERLGIAYLRVLRVYQAERGAMAYRYQYAGSNGITSLPVELPRILQYDALAERSVLRSLRELRRLQRDRLLAARTPAPQPSQPDPAES